MRWHREKKHRNGSVELIREARRLGFQLTAMGDQLETFQERLRREVERRRRDPGEVRDDSGRDQR